MTVVFLILGGGGLGLKDNVVILPMQNILHLTYALIDSSGLVQVTWHHKMSGKSHLQVLRYRHFYTAKNKGSKNILFVLSLFWIKLFQYISTGLPRGPNLNKHIYKISREIFFNKQGNKNMCNLKTNETLKNDNIVLNNTFKLI